MNKKWITQKNHTKLILFFNGWGMDSAAISHLQTGDYDLIELNDYSVLYFNQNKYKNYSEIYVVAWSLGVWAASHILSNSTIVIKKAVAINGTANPVDANEGIHPEIFKGTITGWNKKNRDRFLIRTVGEKKDFEANRSKFGERLIENQKEELIKLFDYSQQNIAQSFRFDSVLIGNKDAIFPYENQLNYWRNKALIKVLDIPHYPFLHFSCWDNIIIP